MTTDAVKTLEKELRLLYHVTETVHSLELDEVLQEIVTVVDEVSAADSIFVYILDPKKRHLILRASKNPHPNLLSKITLKIGEGITGWVAHERKPVAISNGAMNDSRFKYFRSLPEDSFEAFLSVPIMTKRQVIGVINVQHKKSHVHTPMEINMLTAIGKLVGTAVEHAQLIEETMALKEALELRKVVEKAKGILMKRKNIDEDKAYHIMQKESMDRRKSLKEIADAVILAESMG